MSGCFYSLLVGVSDYSKWGVKAEGFWGYEGDETNGANEAVEHDKATHFATQRTKVIGANISLAQSFMGVINNNKLYWKSAVVVELLNAKATLSNIVDQMIKISGKAKKGDVVFIYLTGLGVSNPYSRSNLQPPLDESGSESWGEGYEKLNSALVLYPQGEYLFDGLFTLLLTLFGQGVKVSIVSDFDFCGGFVNSSLPSDGAANLWSDCSFWFGDDVDIQGVIERCFPRDSLYPERREDLRRILSRIGRNYIKTSVCVFSAVSAYMPYAETYCANSNGVAAIDSAAPFTRAFFGFMSDIAGRNYSYFKVSPADVHDYCFGVMQGRLGGLCADEQRVAVQSLSSQNAIDTFLKNSQVIKSTRRLSGFIKAPLTALDDYKKLHQLNSIPEHVKTGFMNLAAFFRVHHAPGFYAYLPFAREKYSCTQDSRRNLPANNWLHSGLPNVSDESPVYTNTYFQPN